MAGLGASSASHAKIFGIISRIIYFLLLAILLITAALIGSNVGTIRDWIVPLAKGPEMSKVGVPLGVREWANVKSGLDTFEQDNGRYPTTEEGLQAMVDRPPGVGESWRRLFDELPVDKWGTPFRYQYGTHGAGTYELDSAGPDKIFDTADDVNKDTHFRTP